ncbi:MAG: hypothetical protein R8P61_22600 [Bacteroidia bacterium]|nr:hypothetical protein [Bacteroidia bacterium]
MKLQIILSIGFSILISASCDPNCNEVLVVYEDCQKIDLLKDTLLISDFEKGEDPTEFCGSLGIWAFPPEQVKVAVAYDNSPPFTGSGSYSAKLTIKGNQLMPPNPDGWVGGGLVLSLSNEEEGIDITSYKNIEFDMRIPQGSFLREVQIRLEDNSHRLTPEPFVLQFGSISPDWNHFTIPLDALGKATQLPSGNIHSLITSNVLNLVTISIHNGTSPHPTDGTLYIDNVSFTR